jgi:hypothetical protein
VHVITTDCEFLSQLRGDDPAAPIRRVARNTDPQSSTT